MPVIALDEYSHDCESCKEKARHIAALQSAVLTMYRRIGELEGEDEARAEFGAAISFLGLGKDAGR